MPRIIAIDYGKSRTGLAETDDLQIIASPLETINSKTLFPYLIEYIKKYDVECIVLGYPTRLNGEDSHISEDVRALKVKIEKQFTGKPVHLQDEFYTSKMASDIIASSGVKKSKRREKGLIDKIAAVIILQSFMDQRG